MDGPGGLSELEGSLIDLLVDGASSFAALFVTFRDHVCEAEADVGKCFGTLRELAHRDLVRASQDDVEALGRSRAATAEDYARAEPEYRAWLPTATMDEASCDEVALWFDVTESGRAAWSEWAGPEPGDAPRWALDDHCEQAILEVRAERQDVADSVLDRWLVERGLEPIPETRVSTELRSFVLKDGTAIPDGILVTCRYRRNDT